MVTLLTGKLQTFGCDAKTRVGIFDSARAHAVSSERRTADLMTETVNYLSAMETFVVSRISRMLMMNTFGIKKPNRQKHSTVHFTKE